MKERKLLICVDFQNDFVNGSMRIDGAEEVCKKFKGFINNKFKEYYHIAMTMDFHPYNHCSFDTFARHCVSYSEGAAIEKHVLEGVLNHKTSKETVAFYKKGTNQNKEEFSIFQNNFDGIRLLSRIEGYNFSRIDICGIASEYCVYNTVKDLVDKGYGNLINLLPKFIVSMGDDEKLLNYATENNLKISEE